MSIWSFSKISRYANLCYQDDDKKNQFQELIGSNFFNLLFWLYFCVSYNVFNKRKMLYFVCLHQHGNTFLDQSEWFLFYVHWFHIVGLQTNMKEVEWGERGRAKWVRGKSLPSTFPLSHSERWEGRFSLFSLVWLKIYKNVSKGYNWVINPISQGS